MPIANQDRSEEAALAPEWPELAHRELVSRVVSSTVFARSERLSTLLSYVCDMTLKGRQAELNEQKIGHAVFRRSPDYDSSIDGIVRTQASRLRQRLDLYFEQEGASEPVRIVIPKGGYIPIFTPHTQTQEPKIEVPLSPSFPQVLEREESPQRRWLPWLLCVLLTAALIFTLVRQHICTSHAAKPHLLWSQLLVPGKTTLDVPGDSGLVLSHILDPNNISLNQYLVGDYRRVQATASAPLPTNQQEMHTELANRRYVAIVDLDASVALAQMADAVHSKIDVRYARDVRPNDLKNGNAILFGANEANPWTELFERNMNFVLMKDNRGGTFSVLNRQPKSGEAKQWVSRWDDPQKNVYAVVALLPNLSGNGNVMLIEGTSMAGTEAAWDFVSDDTDLLPFLAKIQRKDGSVPHFEVLLTTQSMSASAVHSTILGWRVHD